MVLECHFRAFQQNLQGPLVDVHTDETDTQPCVKSTFAVLRGFLFQLIRIALICRG